MTGPEGAPDYVGLVAGVRTWRLANTMWAKMGGWLWSFSMTDCWRKSEEWKEAECQLGHRIPGDECGCGIWAFHSLPALERELGGVLVPARIRGGLDTFEYAAGVIGAGGDIIDCTDGFRAQYAQVLAIFEDHLPPSKEEIAASYGCPTIRFDEYDSFCDELRLIRLDRE